MDEPQEKGDRFTVHWINGAVVVGIALLVGVFWYFTMHLNTPPKTFPTHEAITVPEGSSIREVASQLEHSSVIRSEAYFRILMTHEFDEAFIQAGTYRFTTPRTTKQIARALVLGEETIPPIVLTIPEGLRGETMAPIITEALPGIDRVDPDALDEHIGYLFPETYYVHPSTTLESLIDRMRSTYDVRTEPLSLSEGAHGLREPEIIILASIVEREANDEESKRRVAGILLERLEIGMPLQVDAAFEYLLGKTSAELTEADLKIESPYNTYTNTGLPPTPIANPGLRSIRAVLDPEETPYLYYLTGLDGNFYYAETFEQHKRNKARYLQ